MLVSPNGSPPQTEREFRVALRQLVATAREEDVNVRGAWEVNPDTEDPLEFDIVITAVDR